MAMSEEMRRDENVFLMGEDVGIFGGDFGTSVGMLQEFGKERVRDTPISENAISGCAIGAAMTGMRPIVDVTFMDFIVYMMDNIVNQAAKTRYMFGGKGQVPVVFRCAAGSGVGAAAQHSQSLEAWFAHLPGVVVVCPSTPQDNYALLRASLQCGDPVVYMEHKTLWGAEGPVDESVTIPLGQAAVRRAGSDITIVSWSKQALVCAAACDTLAAQGIQAELIDLRTIWPWDRDTVLASAAKTGRLLVVHEAIQAAGFGAEIAATAAEATGCKISRLGAPRIPVGYAPVLEAQSRVTADAIVARVQQLLA